MGLVLFLILLSSGFSQHQISSLVNNWDSPLSDIQESKLKPIDNELLENPPSATVGPRQDIGLMGAYSGDPSDWWDTDWEYRVNVTVTEPGVADRTNWPVNVFVNFDPPAHKYSIRVYDVALGITIDYQLSNVTYADADHNYLSSATVSFYVTISKGSSRIYQIYWSINEKQIQFFDKVVEYDEASTPSGPQYTFYRYDNFWKAITDPTHGGKVTQFIINGEHYENNIAHFAMSYNASTNYGGYLGTANLENTLWDSLYIEEERDDLTSLYAGVVLLTYVIDDIPIYDPVHGDNYGTAKIKYTFYNWGFIVEEEVQLEGSTNKRSYLIGGWVFDQDNGIGQPRFNYVFDPSKTTEMTTNTMTTGSGVVSQTNNFTLYDETEGKPYYRIYKVYLTADTYDLYFDVTGNDNSYDDMWIMVITPDGDTAVLTWTYWEYGSTTGPGDRSFTVNSGEEGYYYILVNILGDDNHNGVCHFNIWIEDSSGTTIWSQDNQVVYTPDPNNPGNQDNDKITVDQIELIDLVLGPTTNAALEISWTDNTKDLDAVIFANNGTVLGHNCTRGASTSLSFLFNNTYEGHLTLAVIVYDETPGTTVDVSFDYTITSSQGAEWLDYTNSGNFNYTVFLNNNTGYLVGFGYLDFQITSTITPTNESIWYNEGDDTIDGDYIFLAKNVTFPQVPVNSKISIKYILVPGKTSAGDASTVYNYFDRIYRMISFDVQLSKGPIERFQLTLNVQVNGKDEPINGANVSLINSSGYMEFSLLTGSDGKASFTITRKWFNITVSLNSLGRTYKTYVTKDFSELTYDVHSYTLTVTNFTFLIKLTVKAYTNTTPETLITNGTVHLENSTWVLEGKTNDSGVFEAWLPEGTWTFKFNATYKAPEDWDNVTLYDQNWNVVSSAARSHSLVLTASVFYYLKDIDIAKAPTPTELMLYNTPSSFNIYWLENVTIQIDFYELEGHTKIDGTVNWYLYDSGSLLLLHGSKSTTSGRFTLQVNTSVLDAGETYTVKFNATPSSADYSKPAPIFVVITVNERLTSLDVTFNPSKDVYWNKQLGVTIEYKDSLTGTGITGADVYVKIRNATFERTIKINESTQGIYVLADLRDIVVLDVGSYTFIIQASKANYISKTETYTVTIREIPTELRGNSYISIPWTETLEITVEYNDIYYATPSPISGATVVIMVNETSTGNLIESGQMIFSNGAYHAFLNISTKNYGTGTFIITIKAMKKNYRLNTFTITLEINERKTQLTSNVTKADLYYGDNITISVEFRDLDTQNLESISGATVTAKLYIVGEEQTPVGTYVLREIGTVGRYIITVNTSSLRLGTYALVITAQKDHYSSSTVVVTIIVNPIPTLASTNKDSVTTIWGQNVSLNVSYNRTDTKTGVESADNKTYVIYHGGEKVLSGQLAELGNGRYELNLDTTKINEGSYILYIFMQKAFHENQTIVVQLTINPIPTIGLVSSSNITVYWGDTASIVFQYNRTDTWTGIPDATVTYYYTYFANGSLVSGYTVVNTDNDGKVTIRFNASGLFEPGVYTLTIEAYKQHYVNASLTIGIEVKTRLMSAIASAQALELVWGDKTNVTITVTDSITGKVLFLNKDNFKLSTTLNSSLDIVIGEGIYYLVIDTTKLSKPVTVPEITIRVTKTHYMDQIVNISLTVNKVEIEATVSGPESVTLNPLSGGTSTYKVGLFDKSRGGVPVESATVKLAISTGANSYELEMASIPDEPGYYQATVDWANLPIFRPGEDYSISVKVESIEIAGVEIPQSMLENVVIIKGGQASTTVDYLGGSTDLPGFGRVPALLAYPILIVVLVIATVVGYKVVSYMLLPPEVKEIDKLIKQIEKDNYEYETEPRDEAIRKLLEESL